MRNCPCFGANATRSRSTGPVSCSSAGGGKKHCKRKSPRRDCLGLLVAVETRSDPVDADHVEHSAADPLAGHLDEIAGAQVADVGTAAGGHLHRDQAAACLVADDERVVAVVDAGDHAGYVAVAVCVTVTVS